MSAYDDLIAEIQEKILDKTVEDKILPADLAAIIVHAVAVCSGLVADAALKSEANTFAAPNQFYGRIDHYQNVFIWNALMLAHMADGGNYGYFNRATNAAAAADFGLGTVYHTDGVLKFVHE